MSRSRARTYRDVRVCVGRTRVRPPKIDAQDSLRTQHSFAESCERGTSIERTTLPFVGNKDDRATTTPKSNVTSYDAGYVLLLNR